MALLINKELTVLGDIDLSQLYVRLVAYYGPGGSPVFVKTMCYSSKESYQADPVKNTFYVEGIPQEKMISYDRETDGNDLLGYIHTEVKSLLSTDVMEEQNILDPSTGEPILDPSTGLPTTEEVVATPKFCMDSSISFVDVSVG
jgi:hypothetical protein